jgi:hypothetical protein
MANDLRQGFAELRDDVESLHGAADWFLSLLDVIDEALAGHQVDSSLLSACPLDMALSDLVERIEAKMAAFETALEIQARLESRRKDQLLL